MRQRHFAAPEIKEKKEEVVQAWDNLLGHSANRKKNLDQSLQKQLVIMLAIFLQRPLFVCSFRGCFALLLFMFLIVTYIYIFHI